MNLNAPAAAKLLGVSETQVFEWTSAGVLPFYRVQDQLRFNRVELLEWAAARRMKVAPELFDDERRATNGGTPTFRLSRALAAGGIHRNVAAHDRQSALQAVTALVQTPDDFDRHTVAALFAARGGLAPIGNGIAIPHARAPAVLRVRTPIVPLAFLAHPIDMGAHDGQPVRALFVVFSPTIRVHLDVLSKIASALSNAEFHALVQRQAPTAEILDRLSALEMDTSAPAGLPDESGAI